LSESRSEKRKYLYVIARELPYDFLSGGRAVRDYFLPNQERVILEDVSKWVSEQISDSAEE
jgi:hypothetical protein